MMRMKWMLTTFILFGVVALTGATAYGQSGAPSNEPAGPASSQRTAPPAKTSQTDIGISGYEAFTSGTSGHGTKQTPGNSAGGMLEVRHIVSSLVGYEFTYSINTAKQTYVPNPGACLLTCQNAATTISANASQIAFDYVVSHKYGNLRPFAVAGLGFFIVAPGAATYGNNTSVRPTYIYGGGVDWNLSAHFGVRLQYRGNYYKAPNISAIYPATGVFTQSAEPMGGVFYRF